LIDAEFAKRLENLGAAVVVTDDPEGSGNQQVRLDRLAEIRASDPASFWPNQYGNPDNSLAYGAVAEHLIRKIGAIGCLVACVGSGGSISGTGHFLRMASASTRIIAVDTHGSILFGQAPAPRKLRGMGNSIIPKNLRHDLVDEVHWIGAHIGVHAAFELFRTHGLFVGPTSGAAFSVADWYAKENPDENVVFLLPDEGHRYHAAFAHLSVLSTPELSRQSNMTGPLLIDRIFGGNETDWFRYAWRRRALTDLSSLLLTTRNDLGQ
jgi:cysteine synthase